MISDKMNRYVLAVAAVLALIAAGGYITSLVTHHWTVKTLDVIPMIDINVGLFGNGCDNILCSQAG